MAIDITRETLIGFSEACKLLPGRGGKPLNLATLYRFSTLGVKARGLGAPEQVIRLEFVQLGGRRATSAAAIQRFLDALTAAAQGVVPAPPPSRHRRKEKIVSAQKRLVLAGIS